MSRGSKYKGALSCAADVLKKEGMLGFMKVYNSRVTAQVCWLEELMSSRWMLLWRFKYVFFFMPAFVDSEETPSLAAALSFQAFELRD
eukprot:1161903-Pelagomonas_calceolata.AAC.9